MPRPKSIPCVLKIQVDEIRNLPKLNKGSGGADPYVVIEIQDTAGFTLIGGDRELNCASCKTKTLKRVLEGYVLEKFEFNVDTDMIRQGAAVQLTVMDFKPIPEPSRAIGFFAVSLLSIAENGGELGKAEHPLLAFGDITTTFGKKVEHGNELRGYRDSKAPSVLHVGFDISTPEYAYVDGVSMEAQLDAWQFHLLEPAEQDDYDRDTQERKNRIAQERREREEAESKRTAQEKREKRLKDLHQKLHDPNKARTNWREFQDLIGFELMRREWGHSMDKYSGAGGWRRIAGTQVQDERDYTHERLLTQQWLRYQALDKEEESEVRDFATYFNTKRLREMTEHLREWSDFGGRYTAELNPGQRSLGASISRIMHTAKTFPNRKDMAAAFEASAATEEGGGMFTSAYSWGQGTAAGEPVAFLTQDSDPGDQSLKDAFHGFGEFKQALLERLLSGDGRSVWRRDVEAALQHYLGELEVIETFEGIWLSAERIEVQGLISEVAVGTEPEDDDTYRPRRQKTPMMSRINNQELVKSLEEMVSEMRRMTPPLDGQEYRQWRSDCSGKEKELDEARKALERERKLAAKAVQVHDGSRSPARVHSSKAPESEQSHVRGAPFTRGECAGPGTLAKPGNVSNLGLEHPGAADFQPPAIGGHAAPLEDQAAAARMQVDQSRALTRGMSISNLKRGKSVRFPPIAPKTPSDADAAKEGILAGGAEEQTASEWLPRTGSAPSASVNAPGRRPSRSQTPTAAMSSSGLTFYEEVPDADENRTWELEHSNGRNFLFPRRLKTAQPLLRLRRPTTQQISRGVSARDPRRESVFQTSNLDSVQPGPRDLRTSAELHAYVPPAATRWQRTEKLYGGRTYQELDLLPSLHSMSRGGRVDFTPSTIHPRPDTSASAVVRPPELLHGHIEVAPDRPGGPTVHLEARYAKFAPREAFESQLVNAAPPSSADSALPSKERFPGHVAIFDVPLPPFCLFNDLCVGCARKAQEAGAVAAVFIQADEELFSCQGGDDGLLIPVLCVRRSDGLRLWNWVDPPRQFNPPHLRVSPFMPPSFAVEELPSENEAGRNHDVGAETEAVEHVDSAGSGSHHASRDTSSSAKLVAFWRRIFTEDETGRDWISEVSETVAQHLKLPNLEALRETQHHPEQPTATVPSTSSSSKRSENSAGTNEESAADAEREPGASTDGESEFQADKGTILKMRVTDGGVVELQSGVACIVSSSANITPLASGESRDLPGFDRNIEELQRLLPKLGFKVLPPMQNKNADDVRGFLRQVRKGFERGGALSVHDGLLLIVTGHSDGQRVECSMDESGQVGALGIQALMEFFSDLNAPGLKGKLKLFLWGLCLGHPVKEVTSLDDEARHQRNVLNSVETGGQARLVQSTSSRGAVLKVKEEWLQDAEAMLRDEGGVMFTNHVSLSFRHVPYSGALWSRPNIKATGVLIVDLGLFVEGMDTFAVFQLPTIDAKGTSMNVRFSQERSADSPPSRDSDWIEVTDERGVTEFPLFEVDTGVGNPSGSVMKASRVFRVRPFSSRWLRIELGNDGSFGCFDGIGLRQLKLFCSPRSFSVPAHPIGNPTWIENPAEGALGPALNRVGADSVWPPYVMPVYAFAGKPRALDSAIGLASDYTLVCYSVPVDGVSDVSQGSLLLRAFTQLLATAHHKHTVQSLLSVQLQHLLDRWCADLPGGYREQVRLLQRRCDEDDFPVMLSLGGTREVSYGIPGPEAAERGRLGTLRYRRYDQDVPEPRNADRNRSVFDRVRRQVSLPDKPFPASFHPRLRSAHFKLSHRNMVAIKGVVSDHGVTAIGMQLSPSLKRLRWDIRVGGLEVRGRTTLSVPHLRVGVVREKVIHTLPLDEYVIGEDDNSWAIQTGTLTVYRCHGTGKDPERIIGARFLNGDVVTVLLDLANKTLAFTMNDNDMVPPFSNVSGRVVPAVSAGHDTLVKLTIENCRTW